MTKIVLPALCAIGLGSASILVAQSTLSGPPSGFIDAATNAKLNVLRALTANNQRQFTALSYLSSHPLSAWPYAVPSPLLAKMPPRMPALMESQAQRPECPMPVSPPAKINDSMPVTRAPAMKSESMPVAAPLCVNPLGPKR